MPSRRKRSAPRPVIWEMLSRGYRRSQEPDNPYQAALDSAVGVPPIPHPHGSMYRENLPLSDLKPGECGIVLRLNGTFCGRLRLLEMGLTPGTHVRMIRLAAFGGPVDIEVRGYQLSLRREEAAAVWLGE